MSDRVDKLAKDYEENVLEEYPRSIGLFPIPEYPEFESGRGMWSEALDTILTTLRYLAPATLLTIFWGQQSFLFRLLKHIDSAFRAIVFSSEEQKQAALQWLEEAGAVRVEHLETVWRHGWILCGVLDAAMPGACAGHPSQALSLKHAQTIADHYLGVEPVFSRQELESNDTLSKHQEWKLASYLDRIREALAKLTPPVTKPPSQRTSPETTQFTLDYVAKGSGLIAAQVNNKMYFKIYPTSQQSLNPADITILIRGPKDTYGMTVLPPILGKAQMIRQKLLGVQYKPNFTENALPITQGATYLRAYGKNDMNKTYYIPKPMYDIEIDEEIREDYVRIGYVVHLEGKYDISITSRGQNIMGSPFNMTASNNIIGILENESFCLEDGEEIDIVDIKTDRKVVLRIVDFVTEKMLLKKNGSLEKITEDEAKMLMSTDNVTTSQCDDLIEEFKAKSTKFNKMANKIITLNRVCKIFNDIGCKKQSVSVNRAALEAKPCNRPRSQQGIPDIVNSTFSDSKSNSYITSDKRDKFIIPENISVSLRTEKSKSYDEEIVEAECNIQTYTPDDFDRYDTLENRIEDDILAERVTLSSNPFLNDMYEQNYIIEKDFGTFVKTEYETNNSQNEETDDTSIKIKVEVATPSPPNLNPFVDPDILNLERPKTPILKIITGDIKDRDDSVYIDQEMEQIAEKIFGNEFINPFFMHHHQTNQHEKPLPAADFIIGAPVSLPPIIRAQTPEPDMESILITKNKDVVDALNNPDKNLGSSLNEVSPSLLSTPLHTNIDRVKESNRMDINKSSVSSSFHSLDSNITYNVEILSLSNANDNQVEPYQIETFTERNCTPKKDMWDSAYVSIDDSNSCPDSNNNDNTPVCETSCKQKFSASDNSCEFSNMGPAEREIWQTCGELKGDTSNVYEDTKPNKWEIKRPIFTPILEESDRSISSGIKELTKSDLNNEEIHPVTEAFAELNDMYDEYFQYRDSNSNATTRNDNNQIGKTMIITEETDSVDSASDISADVKRHATTFEGKISEVQANVTESVSVSQTLHANEYKQPCQYNDDQNRNEIQFGDKPFTNIVLEKKHYWDEKIREIEAKSKENTTQQKKRRLSTRNLRLNDSLTKRRGKQIVKNFLSANERQQTHSKQNDIKDIEPISSSTPQETTHQDKKLVEKWKKYWDNRLETEKDETGSTCFRTKLPKQKESMPSKQISNADVIQMYKDTRDNKIKTPATPVKQELPEEVFKAFETSPKRFFGTSRKQILNKIDTFLGKPSTADESSADVSGATPDTGLVSSRISLYHNISQTEELPWARRKSQSMNNIYKRKDSEKSTSSVDDTAITKTKNVTRTEIMEQKTDVKEDIIKRTDVTNTTAETKNDKERGALNIALKDKRARMAQRIHNKTYDETLYNKPVQEDQNITTARKTIKELNKQSQNYEKNIHTYVLRKSSKSKSEMDIFNKISNIPADDDLDKYKSCEELPKINVKNYISLYENVSKVDTKAKEAIKRRSSISLNKQLQISTSSGAVNNTTAHFVTSAETSTSAIFDGRNSNIGPKTLSRNHWSQKSQESVHNSNSGPKSVDSNSMESNEDPDKETTYMSLSDIELEIVENIDKSAKSSPERDAETAHIDYKSRFKTAKQFFQSLEEIRDIKKPPKLNECELLLKKSNESLENDRPQKRVKKNIKAHSVPSSEISKIWNQLQESQNNPSSSKLIKISEKYNVEDLFSDVMEGRLSRQGSLRGIPHKKAVLEAFRSMENVTDSKISSYEMAVSQLNQFAKENKIKNAQTYLSEYPYLPTTEPSKYHSRLDTKASGLISFKELIKEKPRRNSVPDLRLNAKFTVDL